MMTKTTSGKEEVLNGQDYCSDKAKLIRAGFTAKPHLPTYLVILCKGFFFKWAILFVYFRSFRTIKTVGFCGIRTLIVGVKGQHADNLTAYFLINHFLLYEWFVSTHIPPLNSKNVLWIMPTTGFEPGSSGVRFEHSVNCAVTNAQDICSVAHSPTR